MKVFKNGKQKESKQKMYSTDHLCLLQLKKYVLENRDRERERKKKGN